MSDATQALMKPVDPEVVRAFLRDEPDFLRDDTRLLGELGLRVDAGNVIDFGPAALARAAAAHRREAVVRREIEDTARANFSAQAQTHAAVIDLLDARNQIDMLMGDHAVARMGFYAPALGLFGDKLDHIRSMALVRMALWEPSRQGILAFGSSDPEAFTPDMGSELVAFLARVVERTAERWPIL
ncbi:MAG: hypothetical protein B7Y81_16540 [Caulobacter sp. 32-67-35]|nr:MAG: hypothetical protein B7Y81_16540 [Caulobacter sp. 32-67-35]